MMMKKSLFFLLIFIALYGTTPLSFAQSLEVANMGIFLNDSKLKLDNPIMVFEGKSYVSLQEAIEKFPSDRNIKITWNQQNQSITLTITTNSIAETGKNIVNLKIGESNLILNGFSIPMRDSLVLYKGRTYFPIRSIATVLGFKVSWDASTSNIHITSPKDFK